MRNLMRRVFGALSMIVIVLSTMWTPIFAQEKSGSGLQISPTRHEISVERGTKKDIEVELLNVSGGDIVAKAVVNDFTSDNATGQPKINPDPSFQSGPSVKRFLTNVNDLPMSKNERKKVIITADVPNDASPGSYYGVLRYQAVPVEAANSTQGIDVSLSASVGCIILLEVPGDLTDSMQIVSLTPKNNNNASRLFFNKFPNKVSIEVKNTGNTFLKPYGKVSITKGDQEIFMYEMNNTIPPGNVLPNTIRIFTNDIKNVNSFGRYTITASIGYGKTGQLATMQTNFWVFPMWVLFAIIAFIALIVFAIITLYRKSKRAKRRRR